MIYVVAGIAFGLLVTAGGWSKEGDITTGGHLLVDRAHSNDHAYIFIFGILVNQLQRGEAAARRVFAAIDLEPTIVDADNATELLGPIESVEFRDVHFTYPNTTTKVLSGISFTVAGGQFLGVMGHTGAGKTTILKLLMRYYVPDSRRGPH